MLYTEPWFGADYYEKHKEAGLDYLSFGQWQLDHALGIKSIVSGFGNKHGAEPRVLDLGCACGSIAEGLFQVFKCPVAGIDPSEHMIKLGRAKFTHLDLRVGCGMDMRMFKDQTFDLVHSMQVFEHLLPHCVKSVLLEVRRVLKVGGIALAYLDYPDAPGAQDDITHTCLRDCEWWKYKALSVGLTASGMRPLILRRES